MNTAFEPDGNPVIDGAHNGEPDNQKEKRAKSDIGWPYYDLATATEIVNLIHDTFGSKCDQSQLAAAMGQTRSGAFNLKLGSARWFGLISYKGGGEVELTPLGKRLIQPDQEARARAEAFLHVPLYSHLYTEYKDSKMPADTGLDNRLRQLGVVDKGIVVARLTFQRSAEQAGFFNFGKDRIIMPALKGKPIEQPAEEQTQERKDAADSTANPQGAASTESLASGGSASGTRHTLIEALIADIPPGREWNEQDFARWLEGFKANVKYVYGIDTTKSFSSD